MKRNKSVKHISAVMSVIMLLPAILLTTSQPMHTSAAKYTDAKVTSMEVEISKIESDIKKKKSELAKISGEKSDREKESNLIYEEICLTEDKIEKTDNLIAELQAQIDDKSVEIDEKSADISEQAERFKSRVRTAYEEGNVSYLEMVLGSGDIRDFLSRLEYINSMIEYDNHLMKNYKAQKAELEDEKAQLEDAMALQDIYIIDLKADKDELEKKKNELDVICAELQAEYAEEYAAYEAARKAEEKLNAELEAYILEMQKKAQRAYVGGEFIWPLDPQYDYVSSYFGWRTYYIYGRKRTDFHTGIDIIALPHLPLDANVYASNGGTVLKAEHHYSYGNYIIIDHGGGITTLYAHNNSLLVKAGDVVNQGQVIAHAGSTGDSTGVHCHFEYRVDGKAQNPLSVLAVP